MTSLTTPAPKLLKSRMRHKRYFMAWLLPLLPFVAGYVLPGSFLYEVLKWTGYVLIIACVLGRGYCSLFIGGKKNDMVMQLGPYSVVRNPLYVFSFLGVAGIGMQSGMFTLMLGLPLIFVLYYPLVIRGEEAYLTHKFGQTYLDYVARVPRWLPRFSLWSAPESIETYPDRVLRTFRDAALFFIPLPVFEILQIMHVNGMLPHYLMIP